MWKAAGKIMLLCVMLFSYSAGQDHCPTGWSCNFNSYYKYISTPKTWAEAEIYCQNLIPGAHLASVHSLEENNLIQQLVLANAKSNPLVWIGASDCYKDRTFMWTDGSLWNFQKWKQSEPNNYRMREPCVQFNYYQPGLWNDIECSASLPFVCKMYDSHGYTG